MHETDHSQPGHADHDEDGSGAPSSPPADQGDDAQGDHVGRRHVAAQQHQDDPYPASAATGPQVPARQQGEEGCQGFGVVVVGRRPVGPGLENQDGQDTARHRHGEPAVRGMVLQMLEDPPVGDQSGAGQGDVLHDQEVDGVGPHPVQQGQRPHDEFEIALVEGVAVVRVEPGVRGVVRVEVARGDLLPSLAVLPEIGCQVEVVPQVPAVKNQQHELDSEHGHADQPDHPQIALEDRSRRWSRFGRRILCSATAGGRSLYGGDHQANCNRQGRLGGTSGERRWAVRPGLHRVPRRRGLR